MMLQKKRTHIHQIRGIFFNVFLVGVTLLICQDIAKADEVPAFFLKIAKVPTLPRVGRSGFENFFYKAEKHIPRIGRNNQRQSTNPLSLHDQESYSSVTKRRIEHPLKAEEWSWQNFPLAIEGPKELWRTLAGYSQDGDDIENEVWQRKKRTRTGPVTTQIK